MELQKIYNQVKNINDISKKIFKYGIFISLLMFFFSGTIYMLNNNFILNSTLEYNSLYSLKTSITLFAEVIIAGLLIDFFMKNNV